MEATGIIVESSQDLTAVARSPAPAVVRVRPGTYALDGLILDGPIQLVGDGSREQIIIQLSAPLQIRNREAALRGLTLIGCNPKPQEPTPAACAIFLSCSAKIENCDIRSETGSCVGIAGVDASPKLIDCRIHDAADSGIVIARQAKPILERCEVEKCQGVGLVAIDGAEPTIGDCRFHSGIGNGLIFRDRAGGIVRSCEISAHQLSNVVIQNEANPIFEDCTIRDSRQGGVFASEERKVCFGDCEIFGNEGTGVEISDSITSLTECRIHGGHSHGVLIVRGSQCWLERCNIHSNRFVNLGVIQDADATLINCDIHDGASNGVTVKQGATALLRGCRIIANGQGNVAIVDGGRATLRDCRIASGRGAGVQCENEARATLHGCDIDSHALPNVAATRRSRIIVCDSTIRGGKQSGVISSVGAFVRIERSRIIENAKFGVETAGGSAEIVDCEFANNKAGDRSADSR